MKHIRISLMLSLLVLFCFFQCKKSADERINIKLKDKPLSVIKSYINGKWQLHYISGGICALCPPQVRTDEFYQFINDRLLWQQNNIVLADTTIVWTKPNVFGDTSWVMNFYDKRQYPYNLTPDGIYNDTLVLYQPGPDGSISHLTKSPCPLGGFTAFTIY